MSNLYRYFCITEDKKISTWANAAPTVCVNDAGHTINTNSISHISSGKVRGSTIKVDLSNNLVCPKNVDVTGTYKLGGKNVVSLTEFYQVSSESQSNTTSTTFQQKLRLSTTTVPSGTYRISWYCEYGAGAIKETTEVRVQLDDTTDLGSVSRQFTSEKDIFTFSGTKYSSLSNAAHTVDLDYRTTGAGTATIKMARLELWRV